MIRTLTFALRRDQAGSRAISYYATQQNAAAPHDTPTARPAAAPAQLQDATTARPPAVVAAHDRHVYPQRHLQVGVAKPLRPDVQRDFPAISQYLAAECRRLCAPGDRLPLLSLAGIGRVWGKFCQRHKGTCRRLTTPAVTDQRGGQFHGQHTANTLSSRRTAARTAGGGMVGNQPRPVNRRSPMDKKQRTQALQRPLFLFTKPQIF